MTRSTFIQFASTIGLYWLIVAQHFTTAHARIGHDNKGDDNSPNTPSSSSRPSSPSSTHASAFAKGPSPIVLIPGDGGSALEAKYDIKTPRPHWWCRKSSKGKWERLWIPKLTDLAPLNIACWTQKVQLHYDLNATTIVPKNAPGVEVRTVPGKEGLNLVPHDKSANVYDALVQSFERDTDADGPGDGVYVATYDFRLAPTGNDRDDAIFQNIQNTVEQAFEENEGTPVVLVTHSMGALWTHYFLTHMPCEWKKKYVHAWVPISPAYGGVVIDLKQLISGDSADVPLVKPSTLRTEQRSYGSSLWLIPPKQLYSDDYILVKYEKEGMQFSSRNLTDLMKMVDFNDYEVRYGAISPLTPWETTTVSAGDTAGYSHHHEQLADPKVVVYPIYGTNVKTPYQLQYKLSLSEEPTVINSVEGDGTVLYKSLKAGDGWKLSQPPKIGDQLSHSAILSDPEILEYIRNITLTSVMQTGDVAEEQGTVTATVTTE
mmetsp:Transcript_1267/g.3662  ORF Transcript_1267/g.3662 Transcript_1267/m.3662 type:complete len:488 (-) Transcript_1267:99-1562(-)|eukprot:CAMPEP_0198118362 /NCGR_PEP_ID=MMETSP1442-20131203/21389_1 /TAXON_ID= /ORGANISM="Craspedostauros australis, Strain CCMP3328" /LENGTH=487 /DNA_ID=CAMNT_0043776609 /DNA_START=88 /DNA_END=1551 /DNA_ORIENTATION=-